MVRCLFLDPLIDNSVWGGALKDPMVPVGDATGDRFVVVTHRHPDHCDPVAIRQVLGDTGTLAYAAPTGIPNVPGVKMRAGALYEPLLLGDFTAAAVPAMDGYGDPQVSWIVSAGGRRIIHCGDTLWHGAWWHIGRQFGPFDAAFLPINGARFRWRKPVTDVPAVMTAEQAVAAAVVLGARLIVPFHYGVVGAEGYAEDPHAEDELRGFAHKRHVDIQILKPGAWAEVAYLTAAANQSPFCGKSRILSLIATQRTFDLDQIVTFIACRTCLPSQKGGDPCMASRLSILARSARRVSFLPSLGVLAGRCSYGACSVRYWRRDSRFPPGRRRRSR